MHKLNGKDEREKMHNKYKKNQEILMYYKLTNKGKQHKTYIEITFIKTVCILKIIVFRTLGILMTMFFTVHALL